MCIHASIYKLKRQHFVHLPCKVRKTTDEYTIFWLKAWIIWIKHVQINIHLFHNFIEENVIFVWIFYYTQKLPTALTWNPSFPAFFSPIFFSPMFWISQLNLENILRMFSWLIFPFEFQSIWDMAKKAYGARLCLTHEYTPWISIGCKILEIEVVNCCLDWNDIMIEQLNSNSNGFAIGFN